MNFLFRKNRLKRAIEQGLANGNLGDELSELGDLELKSRADAEAVCWGLKQIGKGKPAELGENAYALAGLFQDVKDGECDACEVLREHGIPELLRLFDDIQEKPAKDDLNTLMFILKVFALYGTTGGALKIIEAARQPLKADGYMWSIVFRIFKGDHPEAALIYRSLRDPLPPEFIGISLLDAANACLIEGGEMEHPFDSSEGKQRLQTWLANTDPGEFSYAHSATAALPFISNPERDELLKLAMNHPDATVQMEAAWAAAKLGQKDGVQRLIEYCYDFNHAQTAKQYLTELGREDAIPVAANEPGFVALAGFAKWLAHPNELGRVPDDLEIIDHRKLAWPPEREVKPFWLIKYRAKDATGLDEDDVECGLVGSVTFCFFSYKLAQRPPEDAYAVHCYWEMEKAGLIDESDVRENPAECESLLKQWHGRLLENPQMCYVAEVSPELRHPQRLVGLASARLQGVDGWVVLDGERSEWYLKADMPPDVYESVVLKVHVGRQLLGFSEKPDRKKYLAAPVVPRLPNEIITAYTRLLSRAQQLEGKARKEALKSFTPVEKHFDAYVDALVSSGRAAEIVSVIQLLAPYWDHGRGFLKLGAAAFKCAQIELAEDFLLRGRSKWEGLERCEEAAMLAEIWRKRGRQSDAKDLLLECLRKLLAESKTAKGSDKRLFENWFQMQRGAVLRLFPTEGQGILDVAGIPSSILNQ